MKFQRNHPHPIICFPAQEIRLQERQSTIRQTILPLRRLSSSRLHSISYELHGSDPDDTIPMLLVSPQHAAMNGVEASEIVTPVGSPFHSSGMNPQSPVVPPTPLYSPHAPSTSRTSFPQHRRHPPLKRWPNDYTVSEIAAGFRAMDAMVARSPTATQKMAFERVFGGRYVKSTVCRRGS